MGLRGRAVGPPAGHAPLINAVPMIRFLERPSRETDVQSHGSLVPKETTAQPASHHQAHRAEILGSGGEGRSEQEQEQQPGRGFLGCLRLVSSSAPVWAVVRPSPAPAIPKIRAPHAETSTPRSFPQQHIPIPGEAAALTAPSQDASWLPRHIPVHPVGSSYRDYLQNLTLLTASTSVPGSSLLPWMKAVVSSLGSNPDSGSIYSAARVTLTTRCNPRDSPFRSRIKPTFLNASQDRADGALPTSPYAPANSPPLSLRQPCGSSVPQTFVFCAPGPLHALSSTSVLLEMFTGSSPSLQSLSNITS